MRRSSFFENRSRLQIPPPQTQHTSRQLCSLENRNAKKEISRTIEYMQESNEVYNLTPLEEDAVRKGIFSADNERLYSVDAAFDFARKRFEEWTKLNEQSAS
jgi:hypothetical protein